MHVKVNKSLPTAVFGILFIAYSANAQTGINTTSPDPNAALDIVSTSKGVLIPRLSNTQVSILEGSSPANGMLVYNTNKNCVQIFTHPSFECADISIDAWKDNDGNDRVELAYKSDGSNRSAGTEVVIKDNGRVGIGTAEPSWLVDVNGSAAIGQFKRIIGEEAGLGAGLLFTRARGTVSSESDINNNDALGKIQFRGRAGGVDTDFGALIFFADDINTIEGHYGFTKRNLSTEVMTIKTGSGRIGMGTKDPQASLDIRDPNPSSPAASAGISVPQVSNLPSTGNRAGQMVYFTTQTKYYYYDGSAWKCLDCSASNGDVKHSFQTGDHNGWVLLNGRAISSLPASQQAQATALGFSGNLPDATDRVLKKKGTLGSTGGTNSVSLTQGNLPNVSFTGTTNSAGNHNHSFGDRGTAFFRNRKLDPGSLDVIKNSKLSNTTNNAGEHAHTVSVSSGGSGSAVNVENPYLSVNAFIYLGK